MLQARPCVVTHRPDCPAGQEDLRFHPLIGLLCWASGAVLASSGFLQMLTWRGLGIKIQSFIQPFLNEEINCQAVKTRWRVMGSCMHQASKTFQVVSTVMGMTTVLGSLAFLYDLQQSLLLASLPGFLVPVDAGFPATSSIHWVSCSSLPSMISMLDPGEGDKDFQDLAVFLGLTNCGCFLWDTKVTVGLLQKVVYMTVGFVGTIALRGGMIPL